MTATSPKFDLTSLPPFVDAGEGRLMMAMKFFELGRLSLGQAAELAGYTKGNGVRVQLLDRCVPLAENGASVP